MKFRKFGKALLISAVSAGAVLSVTSCVQSYTVGYLYVTGNQTSGSNANAAGIISGFKIDHNTGNLVSIHGLPIASGGANRSEERRVGKECRSRWPPCHLKKERICMFPHSRYLNFHGMRYITRPPWPMS